VFVCNPNNPTGTVVRRAALERFLDRVPADALVVLDEAYREFNTDPEVPDGIDLYRDRPNLAVLRTFSKAYGLAGLQPETAESGRVDTDVEPAVPVTVRADAAGQPPADLTEFEGHPVDAPVPQSRRGAGFPRHPATPPELQPT
jgi:hypothetical protein